MKLLSTKSSLIALVSLLSVNACNAAHSDSTAAESPKAAPHMDASHSSSQDSVTLAASNEMTPPQNTYSKPGPALYMGNDYDGYTKPGQTETINISLSHAYPGAVLTVDTLPSSDLDIITAPQNDQRILSDGHDETYTLSVRPVSSTVSQLIINTDLALADGQHMRRSFGISINSASSVIEKPSMLGDKLKNNETVREKSDAIISMPAEEEIITSD